MMWCAWPLSAPHWAPACLNQNSSNKSWKNINVSGTGLLWLFPQIYFVVIDILKWHEITCFPWSPKGNRTWPAPPPLPHLIPRWSSQGSLIVSRLRRSAEAGFQVVNGRLMWVMEWFPLISFLPLPSLPFLKPTNVQGLQLCQGWLVFGLFFLLSVSSSLGRLC